MKTKCTTLSQRRQSRNVSVEDHLAYKILKRHLWLPKLSNNSQHMLWRHLHWVLTSGREGEEVGDCPFLVRCGGGGVESLLFIPVEKWIVNIKVCSQFREYFCGNHLNLRFYILKIIFHIHQIVAYKGLDTSHGSPECLKCNSIHLESDPHLLSSYFQWNLSCASPWTLQILNDIQISTKWFNR